MKKNIDQKKHLDLRSTNPIAKTPRVTDGSRVRVIVMRGRIFIEYQTEPTLEQMLAAFNPDKHGREVIADAPRGMEVFA